MGCSGLVVGSARGMGPYDPADPPSEHMKHVETALDRLADQGVRATPAPAHGNPADAILEVADDVEADVIVLGSHERSLIEHALGMSVSGAVARKAHRERAHSALKGGPARWGVSAPALLVSALVVLRSRNGVAP